MVKLTEDPKSISYSCKITPRQQKRIDFFVELGINKSSMGSLGIEAILNLLEEIYKDFGKDQFIKRLHNPPSLYGFKHIIESLPLEEQIAISLFRVNNKKLKGGMSP